MDTLTPDFAQKLQERGVASCRAFLKPDLLLFGDFILSTFNINVTFEVNH